MDAMDTTSPSSTPHGQNPDHAETSAPLEVESIIPAPLFKVGDKVRIRDPGFVFLLSGSGPKSKRSLDSIHASQCIDMPDFIQDPNSNLITAVTNLHTHSVPGSFSAESPKLENPCLCLSWSARNTGTEACNAAIAYLKGKYPDTEQDNETWFNAQKLVLDRVSTAQWAAYDAIRAKIGPVVDSLDHSDPQLTFDEYAEGHVQPWMEAKLIRAIRDATLETFAEIEKNTLIKTEPSFCGSFSFYSLSTPYNRVDRSAFTCLCKEYEVFVIAEKAIDATCYRMEVRATCVLGEDDDLKESKERASQYILNAAQDAIECITKDGDEDRGCKVVDEIHMKAWSMYFRAFCPCLDIQCRVGMHRL